MFIIFSRYCYVCTEWYEDPTLKPNKKYNQRENKIDPNFVYVMTRCKTFIKSVQTICQVSED